MFQNRIKELLFVKASELIDNPKNWRKHPASQKKHLKSVLNSIGYADALIARETPEGLMLIDGHLRSEISKKENVPVLIVDLNESEADILLATLDPLASMAEADDVMYKDLIESIDADDDVNALLGEIDGENSLGKIKGMSIVLGGERLPEMTWVLIGIPTVDYYLISEEIEKISENDKTILETTSN